MEGNINVKFEINGSVKVKEALAELSNELERLNAAIEGIDQHAGQTLDTLRAIGKEARQTFRSLVDEVNAIDLAGAWNGQMEKLTGGMEQIFQSLDNCLNRLSLHNPLADASTELGGFITEVQAQIAAVSSGMTEAAATLGGELESGVRSTAERLLGSLTDTVSSAMGSVSEALGNALSAIGIEAFVDRIGEQWTKLVGWFKGGVDEVSRFSEAVNRIWEVGERIVQLISDIVSNPADAIARLFHIDFEGISGWIGKLLPFINNIGKTAEKQVESCKKQWEGVTSMLDSNINEQVKLIKERYAELLAKLSQPAPIQFAGQTDEEFAAMMERYKAYRLGLADFERELEEQMASDIESIRATGMEQQQATLSRLYNDDLNRYLEDERKKIAAEIESLEQIKEERIRAGEDYADIDAQLLEARHKDNIDALNQELLIAGENAKARYEAKKSYLEAELALHEGNAERINELNAEMEENERMYREEKVEALQDFTAQSMEQMTVIDEALRSMEEAKLARIEANNEAEKASLADKLAQGLISQQEHDEQVKQLDENLDQEKAKIAKRQAIRERGMKVFEIAMNTAAAVMKIWAEVPKFDFGISTGVMTALAIAAGVAQTAAVLAAPMPQASRGMLLRGQSHAQGGIPIEAEGGEAIINKRSTAMFAPLLSAINVAGGGVPFTAPMSDGGYFHRTATTSAALNRKELAAAFKEAVKDMHIYTAIEDIRRADQEYTMITQTRPSY